jgi:hypothetical protein
LEAFRSCAVLRVLKADEPLWWYETYKPVLDAGAKAAEAFGYYEMAKWDRQITRFASESRETSE